MLRVDLKSAKILEEPEEGVAGFHALGVTYIIHCQPCPVWDTPKKAQILARQSDGWLFATD
jgi:hypothetical protein